jgi:hypothetical protein
MLEDTKQWQAKEDAMGPEHAEHHRLQVREPLDYVRAPPPAGEREGEREGESTTACR